MTEAIDPQKAVDFIRGNALPLAKAKGERVYLEEFRKSLKAQLMQRALAEKSDLAVGAQEREAYAHPEYLAMLQGLRAAVEEEERLRWLMTAAQARVEVWRSQESSARTTDRAFR